MSTFDERKARAAVAFARETWRNDGAEGETVHVLANAVDHFLDNVMPTARAVAKAADGHREHERRLDAENRKLREDLTKAREMVKRYVVAQGPHLYEAWREALIKDCGLVEDALGFVSVPPITVGAPPPASGRAR